MFFGARDEKCDIDFGIVINSLWSQNPLPSFLQVKWAQETLFLLQDGESCRSLIFQFCRVIKGWKTKRGRHIPILYVYFLENSVDRALYFKVFKTKENFLLMNPVLHDQTSLRYIITSFALGFHLQNKLFSWG